MERIKLERKILLLIAFSVILIAAFISADKAHAGTAIGSDGVTYNSISSAASAVPAGEDFIITLEGSFSENVNISGTKKITIKSASSSSASLTGRITVSGGTELNLSSIDITGQVTYEGTGTTGSLTNCKVVNTNGTAVKVSGSASLSKIKGGEIQALNAGIWIGTSTGQSTTVNEISNVKITSTNIGDQFSSTSTNSAIYLENGPYGSSGICRVDKIENCILTINSMNPQDAGIKATNFQSGPITTSIGIIANNEITSNNYASGIVTSYTKVDSITNNNISINDGTGIKVIGSASAPIGSVGIISGGKIIDKGTKGIGIYNMTGPKENDYGIYGIEDVQIDVGGRGIDNEGYIKYIKGTEEAMKITSRNTDTKTTAMYQYSAIRMSSGVIEEIQNVEMTSGARGIYASTGSEFGKINNCSINAGYTGIELIGNHSSSTSNIESIEKTNITSEKRVGIHNNGGDILSIKDCEIKSLLAGNWGIGVYNNAQGWIGELKDSNITAYTGIGNVSSSSALSKYGTIENCVIHVQNAGLQNQGNMELLKDCVIRKDEQNPASRGILNVGLIKEISGGSISASTQGIVCQSQLSTSQYYVGEIEKIDGMSITAGTYGMDIKANSKAGTLSNNTIKAGEYEAVIIRSGGIIEEIKRGTYEGKTSGVNVQGALNLCSGGKYVGDEKNGLQIVGSDAEVGVISGGLFTGKTNGISIQNKLGIITGAPVFYGETGYAVSNESEKEKVNIEPTLSTQMQGNARYYGALGVENNNHIQVPDKDTYPVFTPTNLNYKMSKNTTSVDGFDGVPFHYLTVDIDLKYDGNGGTGNVEGYSGEYRDDLTAEENGFTRNNYVFTGWNTKADGKGTAYKPGDTIDITEEKTTLYAQWEYRGSIEVSFGILNPSYRIDGVRLRDIQSSYYYCVSWLLQPFYSGGAATLVDSNGEIVESFSDEYQYTFDNLPPGEYDIVLDVLDQGPLCLNAGVHNGAPRSDIIVWSEDSDKLHITIPENGNGVIRRWISLERKAFGFKTVTDVGEFRNNPSGSEIPGKPSSDGKEYVYYAVRDGGNNWSFENPQIDEKPHMPFVQSHIGIYYGENASQYSGMTGLQVPELSDKEKAMGYKFKGWKLQGDNSGKIYTESEALAYTVRKHVVFEALWDKAPPKNAEHKFEGKAILLKNGVQKDISAGQFEFTISHLSGDADGFTGIQSGSSSVNSDGSFSFDKLTFSKAGEYKFEINQIDKGQAGYLYDMNPVTATVKVTYNENNNSLEAAVEYVKSNTDAEGIFFTNTYSSLPVKSGPQAEKKVEGEPEEPSEFTFVLTPKNEEFPMPDGKVGGTKEVTIKGGGKVEFGDIDFDKEGVYEYTVKEKIPEDADESGKSGDYIYDKAEWTIKYEVTDDEEGQLVVKKTITKNGETVDSIEISNRYEKRAEPKPEAEPEPKPEPQIQSQPEPQPKKDPLPCVGDPPVEKKIEGNPDKDTTFTFILTPKDPSNPMPDGKVGGSKEGTITGAGSFEFGDIIFTKEGTYEYTVAEKIPEGADANNKYGDYVYDDSKWTIRYVVTDNNGQLEVTRTFLKDGEVVEGMQAVTITNVYENPVAAVLEEEEEEAESEEIEEKTKEKTIEKTKAVKTKTVAKNSVSPKTEDEFNLRLWIVLVTISAIGLMWAYAFRIRCRN